MSRFISVLLCGLLVSLARGGEPGDVANGWRGNGTGLWPEARPPLEWYRIPKGVIADLRACPNRPGEKVDGASLAKGIVRDWLVVGPFPMAESLKGLDEATVRPSAGDKAGDQVWKTMAAPLDDRWAFGPATPPIADLASVIGAAKPNQAAYAHTYLYTPKGGTIRAVVDHTHGMTAWLNGVEVYRSADRKASLGSYYPFSRAEFCREMVAPSPRFDLELKPGWNRLLLRLTSFTREDAGWNRQTFLLRLLDLPSVPYESKNIRWMTELPQRSNAAPLIVGNRVFVMAEPDELLCLDKETGKILWTAANNYYEALTPEERAAKPAYKEKIEPLLAALRKEGDFVKRLDLRTRLQRTLMEIDPDRFAWKADGHFEAHFGIVGFTSPSPLSDGKHVWVWCGNGVAACYDLEGKRRWITRIETNNLSYSSSPALADGTFAVYLGKLIGLDAQTGKVRWEQKKIDLSNGALLAGRIGGVPVFVSSLGNVVRARDGKMLYREPKREGRSS
ncbi:MAG: PQQ-binding-like beta-propeller repeat protein [Gemmataceae bacterium]